MYLCNVVWPYGLRKIVKELDASLKVVTDLDSLGGFQGRSDGGISVYIPPPPNQSTLIFYVVVLSPWPRTNSFIPTQIKFLATPLVDSVMQYRFVPFYSTNIKAAILAVDLKCSGISQSDVTKCLKCSDICRPINFANYYCKCVRQIFFFWNW